MFGRKRQPAIRSLVGEGTVVHGEVRFTDGLRVDGEVEGDVTATGEGPSLLVISEKARVAGRVSGGHVIINGTVQGPVVASQLLELQPKAVIVGDVRYEVLEMHQGATIHGELRPTKAAERPGLKLAVSKAG